MELQPVPPPPLKSPPLLTQRAYCLSYISAIRRGGWLLSSSSERATFSAHRHARTKSFSVQSIVTTRSVHRALFICRSVEIVFSDVQRPMSTAAA